VPASVLPWEAGRSRQTRGYWDGDTWFPDSCRLRRLTPFSMIQVLNRKTHCSSATRSRGTPDGVLQMFLSSRSRESFLRFLLKNPRHSGSALQAAGVPRRSQGGSLPASRAAAGRAGRCTGCRRARRPSAVLVRVWEATAALPRLSRDAKGPGLGAT